MSLGYLTDEDVYDYTIIPGIKYVYFLRDDKNSYRCSQRVQ